MTIKVLDGTTIRNLHSGQVIVDLEAIVKELVENSIDAQSTSIELVLMNNGLGSIQIKDDGDGIEENDRLSVAKRHYTSKIKEFHDLEKITSYGFRGEAINSICSISDKCIIITKTKNDTIAKQYDVDKEGTISNEKPSNVLATSGTIVTLHKPFYNLHIRRQLAQKNAASNMKKIQELLIKYALAHPKVRFSCQQSKDTAGIISRKDSNNNTWVKPVTASVESTMAILFGAPLTDMLERFIQTDSQHTSLTVDVVLPKSNSDPSVILKGPDRMYFYVNQRPINYVKSELKELVTTIRNRYKKAIGLNETNKKTPFIYIDIQIPPDEYDVNIEPNKTTILFHNKERVINLVEKILDDIYPSKTEHFFHTTKQATVLPEKSDSPSHVNVVQPSSPVQQQDNTPTSTTTNNLKMYNWGFSMMDDELDELESDDGNNEQASKKHDDTEKTSKNNQQTAIEGWQIDDASTTIPTDPTTASGKNDVVTAIATTTTTPLPHVALLTTINPNPPPTTSVHHNNNNNVISRTTTNHQVTTNNKPRTIHDALLSDKPTTNAAISNPIYSTKPTIPRKRRIEIVNEDDEESTSMVEERPAPPQIHASKSIVSPPPPPPRMTPSPPCTMPQRSKRDMSSLCYMTNPPPSVKKNLCNTFNQAISVNCSLEEIKSNYPQRKEILAETYRVRIDNYLAVNDYHHQGQMTSLIKSSVSNGLSFYTRGNPSTLDKCRHQIFELGVIKMKPLCIEAIVNQLAKECKIVCKKQFDRPVQIQLSHQDILCPALLGLKSKEGFIDDDLHGQKKVTYSEIVDENVVLNGFKVRWRKDLLSGNMIIQFTGIYALGLAYGTSDFRELLSLVLSKPNEFVRPTKIMDHLRSLAEEIYRQKGDSDTSMTELEKALDDLSWKKEGDEWKLGYSTRTNKLLACMLASPRIEQQND